MSVVIIIEPYSSGVLLIDACVRLSVDFVILSYCEGQRKVADDLLSKAMEVVKVDTNDENAVLASIQSLTGKYDVKAIVPGCEYCVSIAAKCASNMGINGLNPVAAEVVRQKDSMRLALVEAGLRAPKYRVIETLELALESASYVGYPVVMKPTNMSGSLGVRLIENDKELIDAWSRLHYLSDLGLKAKSQYLIEEYIAGPEFSVEGYVSSGNVNIVAHTQKLLCQEPYFVEIGHVVPANLAVDEQAQINEYITRLVTVLGINIGVFHAEVRLGEKGPVLIEIAARLPGDNICELVKIATSVDLPLIMLSSYLGFAELPKIIDAHLAHAGIGFFYDENVDIYHEIVGLSRLENSEYLVRKKFYFGPGTEIPKSYDSEARIGYFILESNCGEIIREEISKIHASIEFI